MVQKLLGCSTKLGVIVSMLFLALPFNAMAQTAITTEKIADDIYMLVGKGGDIGVFVGKDGTFMIDDKFADVSVDVLEAIRAVGGDQPGYLVNTHFHGDHTGGNENFGSSGSTVVSHHNVHKRLAEGSVVAAFGMETPPAPQAALPGITFDSEMILHLNGDHVRIFHVPNAHTDGDAVVVIENANVIHTGDLFFNGFYPFIDVGNGGRVQGVIDAVNQILSLTNANTRIIPGHGPVTNKQALESYRDMLVEAESRISQLKEKGMSADEVVAASPLADLEESWGNGIFTGDQWIRIVFDGI